VNFLHQTLFYTASIHTELDSLKQFVHFIKRVSVHDELTVQSVKWPATGWKVVVQFSVRAWI